MTNTTQAINPMLNFDGFTTPTEPDRIAEILAALTAAQHTITSLNLPASSVEITPASPGAREWDPNIAWNGTTDGWTLPTQPTIRVRLHSDVAGFYRWCKTLNADRITVERQTFHTDMSARIRTDDLTWQVTAELHRPQKPHPHLPGIPAPWTRENGRLTDFGRISLDDLRTVLDALDVPTSDH